MEGIEIRDADGDRLAAFLVQRAACAAEEALEEIAGSDARFDFERGRGGIFANLDERDKKVIHAIAELLHIGVLIGRALVAVNRDALVDDMAIEVELLAERFHDKLLEVAAEEEEAVFVREDDHVFQSAPAAGVIPHEGEQHGGILPDVVGARLGIHRRGSFKEFHDFEPLQRHRHEPHGAHHRGPAADPVPHRKPFQPSLGHRHFVQVAPLAGDGHKVFCKWDAGFFKGRLRREHAVAGFLGAAGFGNDDDERAAEAAADLGKDFFHAVGVGVVKKVRADWIFGGPERVGDELWAERGSADADHEEVGEFFAGGGKNFSRVDGGCEIQNRFFRGEDRVLQFLGGSQRSVAEPVMSDHAVFVGVGDGARLELFHLLAGPVGDERHSCKIILGKIHPADVHRNPQIIVAEKILLEPAPE